jgi:titin
LPAVFVVTNINNSGAGSLRQALLDANSRAGLDVIEFNIPGAGPHSIAPTSALPTITDPVIIDGTSEPDFAGTPVIELNGTGAGALVDGVTIAAGGSTVRGLAINRFGGSGIRIQTLGGNTIAGNFLGTDPTGLLERSNTGNGVFILNTPSNTIGGTTAATRNVIAGNDQYGVLIQGGINSANQVQGNFIGTRANGTQALGNTLGGVQVLNSSGNTIGGTAVGARNIISGNLAHGVFLSGSGTSSTQVQGNYIGTDVNGTADLGNALSGILIATATNTIGGTTAAARNLISGNNRFGVEVSGSIATGNLMQGNYIGTNVSGTGAVGNSLSGLRVVDASSNTIGGTVAGAGNVISGNVQSGIYILGTSAGTTTNNLVQGNFIGTNVTGTADLGNGLDGVKLDGTASSNTVGGTTAAARNIISGNNEFGVFVLSAAATSNLIQGNYIGTNVSGTGDVGNSQDGVRITQAPANTIGGTVAGAGNLVSANDQNGIHVRGPGAINNLVRGNFIGTNAAGTAALGNVADGVLIFNIGPNTIGGTTASARNVISGNRFGVNITGGSATGVLVQGNYIGTNASGAGAVGNTLSGVVLPDTGSNTIGGTAAGSRNVISGNVQNGVYINGFTPGLTTGNLVQGNYIGTNAAGTADLGNTLSGVKIDGPATSNTIGGNTAAARNVISGNNEHGVLLLAPGATGNLVQGNYIGTAVNGTSAVGNTLDGVRVANAGSNSIGGTAGGVGNTIGFNGQNGVRVTGVQTGNQILRNAIFSNVALGIDLNGDGVTANDANDPDSGANKLQNFPVMTSAVLSGANLTVTYSVPSVSPNSTFPLRVEFFITDAAEQEGQTLLRADSYAAPGAKVDTFAVAGVVVGTKIVATATDANGNTSEFSANVTVAAPLMAAGGEASPGSSVASQDLDPQQLAPIIDAAIARWAAQGLSPQQLNALSSVSFAVADLPGATLGLATPGQITLDATAAGYGWFIDPTPLDDAEFSNLKSQILDSKSSDSQLRMDLLTAVMHELGHTLGWSDEYGADSADDFMHDVLALGQRRTSHIHATDAILGGNGW